MIPGTSAADAMRRELTRDETGGTGDSARARLRLATGRYGRAARYMRDPEDHMPYMAKTEASDAAPPGSHASRGGIYEGPN